ncbi:ferredoxin reductase family protein [Egicoccus halophilus]|uniref:Ferric reductase n=1 Tax=Egicoccus halophilus TaxID=1670830 RepID=A0A8J3AHN1_9ACTN|nr:ferric reductase-like transmembrane domain-containing protein [Egicoccus halophilus]GGI08829.1 ferric reductase [Egicoccus halophilus]
MPQFLRGFLWIQLYVLVSVVPLAFALLGETPPGRDFVTELSVALGFVGLAMLGLQFAITARFGSVAAPFGMDVVIRFHRLISLVAFAFVLAHPILLFVTDPATLELLRFWDAPWRARFGLASVVLLVALVVTSVYRTRLGLSYEVWKVAHGVLAVAIVATALLHVQLVGYYVATVWKQVLWVLMSAALVGVLGWVRIVKPVLQLRQPWEVVSVEPERGDAWTVTLRPVGHDGLRALPGQYAWLIVDGTPFSAEEHPYSLSGSTEREDGHVSFTIKALGDWSAQAGDIEPGTRAYVDGPYGVFSPDRNEAPGFLFVAGGVGITPFLGILQTMADRGDRRPITLVHAGPTLDELIGLEHVESLRDQLDLELVLVLEEPPDGWEGETGLPDADLLDRVAPDRQRTRWQYFVCGPPPMLDAVEEALEQHGVPMEQIQIERFDLA